MVGAMQITIRHTEGCPNVVKVEERLRRALEAVGERDAAVARELVQSQEEAERLQFPGSPTILIDGSDPFAEPAARPGLACRIYPAATGTEGAPAIEDLERAIRDAAHS